MGQSDDLVFGWIRRLLNAGVLPEVGWRSYHDSPHFADSRCDHGRVGEVAEAERNVDPLVDQVDHPVEEKKPRGHRRVSGQERIQDR